MNVKLKVSSSRECYARQQFRFVFFSSVLCDREDVLVILGLWFDVSFAEVKEK